MTNDPQRRAALGSDETVVIGVRVTRAQVRELNRRSGLPPFCAGRARSEYIVGCLFGEPSAALIERVQKIAEEDRATFRAELLAACEERVRRSSGPARERAERHLAGLRELERAPRTTYRVPPSAAA